MLRSQARTRPARASALLFSFGAIALAVAACATSRGAELEPRYVAVHNAFAAMGLVQVGPIQQGTLAEGKDARVTFDLAAQCATIVAVGGEGVRDLDVTLIDPAGKPVAHDTTKDAQAVVRACVETAGTYTLAIKMAAGSGTFVAGTWSGGLGAPGQASPSSTSTGSIALGAGTCESPIVLTPGTSNGTTGRGENENEGSCGRSDSKEVVYRLDVAERQRVSIDVHPRFDAVLYVRKDECGETSAEVGCNDDAPNQDRSKLDLVLDPGTYFVFVDGYGHEAGTFRMSLTMSDVPALAEVCRRSRPLSSGAQVTGTTVGAFDNANSSCGNGAKGLDSPYKLDVGARSRVRVTEHSDDIPPVVHLRKACADEQSEIACSDTGMGTEDATYVGILDPGSYTIFADAKDRDATGRYTLLAEVGPEHGSGGHGDACGDAIPIGAADKSISGDTFLARDDVAGKCGGAGAGDVIYRFELPKRARISARFEDEEGRHLFVLSRTCADKSGELACGPRLDEVLPPGVYFLTVDGAAVDSFGKFQIEWHVRDVGGQETACRTPPTLIDGQTVNGTTVGAGDKFTSSCAGREDNQGSPDRMYKIVLAQRAKVRVSLSTPTFDGVLVLRRSCMDTGAATRAVEVQCNNDHEDSHHSRVEQTLEAGTYYVLVDGHAAGSEGGFSLEYKIMR